MLPDTLYRHPPGIFVFDRRSGVIDAALDTVLCHALAIVPTILAIALTACGADSAQPDGGDPTSTLAEQRPPGDGTVVGTAVVTGDPHSLTTRQRLSRSASDVRVEQMPDGTRRVNLQGRLHQASVARMTPDGRLERSCVDTPEALDRWLSNGSGPPSVPASDGARGGATP